MRRETIIILFLLLNISIAQNVIVVVIDGARYTETFEAVDPSANIPRMWNDLKPLGTLFSNFRNNGTTSTNPGHSSILTGTWQTIANNGTERPTKPTLFEYYRKEKSVLMSKGYVIAGKEKLNILNYSIDDQYGPEYKASVLAQNLTDKEVFTNLIATMNANQPNIIVVNFPEVDITGHSGDSIAYINAIYNVDSLVYELWNKIQSDSFYKDNTTLFITNDHGRHTVNFVSHGDDCEGCEHIMLLALGRHIPKNNIISVMRDQTNIASSIGELLEFDTPQADGLSLFRNSINQPIEVNIKVFLEGPFSNGAMTSFQNERILKIQNSKEESNVFNKTTENVIIDTILVELRTDKDVPSDIIKKASLLATGDIVELDGVSPLSFSIIPGSYYIVVRHRNHLSVMSKNAISFPE